MFCSPNPCEHDGRCVETLQGYKCVCQDGYTGVNCKGTHVSSTKRLKQLLQVYLKRPENITSDGMGMHNIGEVFY